MYLSNSSQSNHFQWPGLWFLCHIEGYSTDFIQIKFQTGLSINDLFLRGCFLMKSCFLAMKKFYKEQVKFQI